MYLALLNEDAKKNFLGMVFNLATADGEYSAVERKVINAYCHEMQFTFDEKSMVRPMDTLVQEVKLSSDSRAKKIFIFELIGFSMIDGDYHKEEKTMIYKMMEMFNIDESFAKTCESEFKEYIGFQKRLNQLVLE